jgi:PHD/YefM family antitoxin component YafN of YafNO toxin-antitoxin module
MKTINPQYIKNSKGENTLVVLQVEEFNALMEELEELEDIRLYDEAKKEDSGERVLLDHYLESRKKRDV